MKDWSQIEHLGIVQSVLDQTIEVNITALSACSTCHAKGACSVSDIEEKVIEIFRPEEKYEVGERVNVSMKQSLGLNAVFLGYVMPFLLILVVLIITTSLGLSEGKSGLLSLAPLPVYYLILYYFKDRLRKRFSFSIHKLD